MNRQVSLEVHIYSTGYKKGAYPGHGWEGDGAVLFNTTSSDPQVIEWDELQILACTIMRGLINLKSSWPEDAQEFVINELKVFEEIVELWDSKADDFRRAFKVITDRIETFTTRTRKDDFVYKVHLDDIHSTLRLREDFEGFGWLATTRSKHTGLRHFIKTAIWYFWKCHEHDDSYILALSKICSMASDYFLQDELSTAAEHEAVLTAFAYAFYPHIGSVPQSDKLVVATCLCVFVGKWKIPILEARLMASDLLEEAKKANVKLPDNYGDILLQKERTDHEVKAFLELRRRDGVTDEDIRRWWNLPDLERRILHKREVYDKIRFGTDSTNKYISEGLSKEAANNRAIALLRKMLPVYAEPDNRKLTEGDDRPLPRELMSRVENYLNQRRANYREYAEDCYLSTSFNAIVRRDIAKGKL